MANGERREGLGFWAGALFGLLFSAVVLIGLSLSVPLEAPEPAPVPARPTDAEAPPLPGPDPVRDEAAAAATSAPDGEPVAGESGEAPGDALPELDPEPDFVPDAGAAPDPDAAADLSIAAIPAGPLWRVNATDRAVPDGTPLVAVVLHGLAPTDLPALEALAALGPLSVTLDTADGSAPDLMALAAGLGVESLAVVDGGEGAARAAAETAADMVLAVSALPRVVGFAMGGQGERLRDPDEAGKALTEAARERALVLDLDPAEGSALVELGRASRLPVAAPALRIGADETAAVAFQRLRGAADAAARSGDVVVLVEASPATLTALGRWLALPGAAQPAPLTVLVDRAAPTRF